MNKSGKLTKVLSVAIAVVMLLGVMACGMIASAVDRGEWNASTQYNGGDTVTYQGATYQANYWTQGDTPNPDDEWGPWKLVGGTPGGNTSTVTIKDGAGNTVGGTVSVGIEEGSVFFTATTTDSSAISWAISNNNCGAILNPNYNGGALISFTKSGSVTLVASDGTGSKAQVVITVDNSTIQLNASTVNGAIRNGDTLTIEQGQALEVLVDCTDPSKLTVNKTGSSVNVTQGSTGVPVTVLGTAVGSSQITLEILGKTLAFTVNVKEATTANFTANGSPIVGLTTVDKGKTIDVTCSLAVTNWVASNGDITVVKSGNIAKITGNTLAGLATVTAYGANNVVLGTFDVYVTDGNNGQFVEILDESTHSAVSTVNMNAGDTKKFIGDCTIEGEVAGALKWQLLSATPANCVTLTTGGNDGNGNVLATIKANAQGTAVLQATANGLTDTITINVGNGGTTGGEDKIDGSFLLMKRDVNKGYLNGTMLDAVNYGGGVYATPLSVNGTYALPLRSIGEAFGMRVDYLGSGVTKITNAKGDYVVVTRDSTLIEKFDIGNNRIASFNAEFATYSVPAGTSSITYVPMRAVSEALGLGVRYVSGTESGVGTSYVAVSTDMYIELKMEAVKAEIAKAYSMGLK